MDSAAKQSLASFSLEAVESMGLQWERRIAKFENYLMPACCAMMCCFPV